MLYCFEGVSGSKHTKPRTYKAGAGSLRKPDAIANGPTVAQAPASTRPCASVDAPVSRSAVVDQARSIGVARESDIGSSLGEVDSLALPQWLAPLLIGFVLGAACGLGCGTLPWMHPASCVEEVATAQMNRSCHEAPPPLTWPLDVAEWPECTLSEVGVVKDIPDDQLVVDLNSFFGEFASSVLQGCLHGNCSATDRFEAREPDDCARVCSSLDYCQYWTHQTMAASASAEAPLCRLLLLDAGNLGYLNTGVSDPTPIGTYVAGHRSCVPTTTVVKPRQALRAVLASVHLRVCDGGIEGVGNPPCSSLVDALLTWEFALRQMQELIEEKVGDPTFEGMVPYVDHLLNDVKVILKMEPGTVGRNEAQVIITDNNRKVLSSIAELLNAADDLHRSHPISPLDISAPLPARGFLCHRGDCGAF